MGYDIRAMKNQPLSPRTRLCVARLFAPELRAEVEQLLTAECGNSLPFLANLDASRLERFQFAAIKLSAGRMDMLLRALLLAQRDWRDLLMAAGFGEALDAHDKWFETGCMA